MQRDCRLAGTTNLNKLLQLRIIAKLVFGFVYEREMSCLRNAWKIVEQSRKGVSVPQLRYALFGIRVCAGI